MVNRLVAFNACPTSKALEILKIFESIDIFTVDSIESTYTLKAHSHIRMEEVAVELDGSNISIMISADSILESDLSICKELAGLLDVPMPTLFVIISMPHKMVEGMMQAEGISDIPEGFLIDPGIERVHTQVPKQTLSSSPVGDQARGNLQVGALGPRASAAAAVAQLLFDESQLEEIRAALQNMGQGSDQPDRVVGPAFNSGLVAPIPMSRTARQAADTSSIGDDGQSAKISQSDEYKRVNAILGECFVSPFSEPITASH